LDGGVIVYGAVRDDTEFAASANGVLGSYRFEHMYHEADEEGGYHSRNATGLVGW
jgi:hypothetical protein